MDSPWGRKESGTTERLSLHSPAFVCEFFSFLGKEVGFIGGHE